ncbi:SDR family NAD(P)-dependent oxidoreductase [Streptomyces sp. NPDC047002]|uniref:SDR family NAD(P)-dependent oxidoreductase n=1 Tax=Streptomyces sp. NPDC047002 TaxID=3155475 RepID=UPI003453D046
MRQDEAEPVAVVGAACRLPGGIRTLDGLWDALLRGADLVGEVPEDRYDPRLFTDQAMPRRGKSYTAAGGFLDDVAGFDAAYFGISPKEAAHMDPQHRLLLEMTAEALDDAAVDPADLAGSDTAVFVGISDASYGALQMSSLRTVGPYTMSGAASSIAANRLSHAFDLRGPSMAVDTACSSSLVALDRACRTLADGTARTAVCGGVNVLLSPFHYVGFSQASMLSRRGRCASFSAHADGFVRAEGGGVVLLKRLSDALADGDRVHGLIAATGANSDGRTMGLALPNPEAQERLLREVYQRAGIGPDELVYFEAHGTGTPVGDPVEALAIGRALGVRRIGDPLPLGSVKTNLGHLEPASGMAGLFKALLVLRHRMVPPAPHDDPPHPDIDFEGLGLRLAGRAAPVEPAEPGARAVVGVNSFGFGGANAHAVVADAPPAPARTAPPRGPVPLLVSARTATALSAAARATASRLESAEPGELYDLAHTSFLRRGRHEHRAVVWATTPAATARGLRELAGEPGAADAAAGGATGPAAEAAPGAVAPAAHSGRTAFVFAGNGSQWAGMGAGLLATDREFGRAIEEVDGALAPALGWSVAEVLASPPGDWRLDATEVAQPLLFAVQTGIAASLRARGIAPAMVVGHSVGEAAAAHVCGALTLADAARVVAARSLAQAATAGTGRMAAAALSPERAADELAPYGGLLEVAGVNSAQDVTLAGDADALAELGERLTAQGVFFRDLGLDHAFHSSRMDPVEEPLRAALAGLAPGPVQVPFYSTVTGARARGTDLDAAYWWHNVRRPVLFADAVRRALHDGAGVLLEIGPHPVLRGYLRRATAGRAARTAVLSTLRRGAHGPGVLAAAAAGALAAGAAADPAALFPAPGRVADLPAYPWQRERHWCGTPASWANSSGDGVPAHPLLGERMPTTVPSWEGAVEPVLVPWLADHRLGGSVVMPATGYAEALLAAGRAVHGCPVELAHLDVSAGLVVPWADATAVRLRTGLDPDTTLATLASTDEHGPEPRIHARARVRPLLHPRPAPLDPGALRARCTTRVGGDEHYATCAGVGLVYGPAFRLLDEIRIGEGTAVAAYRHGAPGAPYTVHPALLDGALQAGVALLYDRLRERGAYLPASIGSVRVWSTPSPTGVVWVEERGSTESEVCWDITLADDDGTVTARLTECRLRLFPMARATPVTRHHTVVRAAPHAGLPCAPSPLPAPAAAVRAAAPRLDAVRADWRLARYPDAAPAYARLTARATAAALARLLPDPAAAFTADDLVAHGVRERHRPLLALLVPLLLRAGAAEEVPGGRLRLTEQGPDDGATVRDALAKAPGDIGRIALTAHLTRHLGAVLTGREEALDLLTAEPAAHLLEQYYDTAPLSRFHNRVAQALLRELLAHWPADRALRVLEVGAGTGGTAAALLPLLPADRTRYHYTDVSPAFLTRARGRFGAYDFVDYGTFDLDRDPGEQGLTAQGYDLVVAANALHTARDLEAALRRVASLLAPGGHLLGFECHDAEVLLPVFGALASFHRRTDTALRPDSPLLPRAQWPALLKRCGFPTCAQTGDTAPPAHHQASVFLAATPTAPTPAPALRAPVPVAAAPTPVPASEATAPAPSAPSAPALMAPASQPPTPAVAFLVHGDAADDPLPAALAAALVRHGAVHAACADAGDDPAAWRRVLDAAGPGERDVVLVLGGPPPADGAEAVDLATRAAQVLRAAAAAHRDLGAPKDVTLWLVTRPHGAEATPGPVTHPADAAAWGVARCLANEQPDLRCRRVSLHRGADPAADADRLVRELLDREAVCDQGGEDEIVLTAHDRFVPRERALPAAVPVPGAAPPRALRVHNPGLSYTLAWREIPEPAPGPGQIAVDVRAAALNYRDIMQTVGLLPTEALAGSPREENLGLECAGVVTACGPGVAGYAPGDRVVGLLTGALASRVVTPADTMWPIPEGVTFAEATSVPVAFCTVHHSLLHTARMRAGETILVHGAAGGVGLAALQYARAHGVTVIATAGSEPKRDLLRALGVEHVLDSRSLDFTVRVMELTEGRGVDIVLNSLSGQALARGLEVLRSGGRFIELGKRDFYEDRTLPLRPFGSHLSFHGVDLTTVLRDPRLLGELLTDVGATLGAGGAYHPLPHTVFPAARVADAFLLMRHSRHLGKVVIAFDPLDEPGVYEPLPRAPRLDPAATYLVTGGTSGFGAATARALAARGARRLALVARSGDRGPEAAAVRDALAAEGVRATVYAADAADADRMREVLADIEASGHPLRGVVHAAMVLDDAPLADLTAERLAAVLRPKIAGAQVLDTLTRGGALDFFVCYSSTTAMVGNLTQAAYTAGNLYLEGLARQRRRRGEPALTLAWGAIDQVGYAARNGLLEGLGGLGIESLPPDTALRHGALLLGADRPDTTGVVGVARTDWSRAATLLPLLRAPRLRDLVPPQARDGEASREELLRMLARMDEESALAYLVDQLTRLLADTLHMEHDALDPHRRLDSYGMDSLMAAQVLVSLNQRYELDIPPMELLRSNGTIAEFARIVHLRLGLATPRDHPTPPPPNPPEPPTPLTLPAPTPPAEPTPPAREHPTAVPAPR